jgi:hypothetical protein
MVRASCFYASISTADKANKGSVMSIMDLVHFGKPTIGMLETFSKYISDSSNTHSFEHSSCGSRFAR